MKGYNWVLYEFVSLLFIPFFIFHFNRFLLILNSCTSCIFYNYSALCFVLSLSVKCFELP